MYNSEENNQNSILDEKYLILNKLGSGYSCTVYLGRKLNSKSPQNYAIKIMRKDLDSDYDETEIKALSALNDSNIVKIIEFGEGIFKDPEEGDETRKYLVLELATNGEVFDYIFYPKKGFEEKFSRRLFLQLVKGLQACHDNGVVHRDLKPDNLMMDSEWSLKLADFGFSKIVKKNSKCKTYLGTESYMSPEVIARKQYDGVRSDIFSLGVILFILVNGVPPMGKATRSDPYYSYIYNNNTTGYLNKIKPYVTKCSDEFKDLFIKLISVDPEQRPLTEEILDHPWLKMEMSTNEEFIEEMNARKKAVVTQKAMEAQQQAKRKNKQGHFRSGDDKSLSLFDESVQLRDYNISNITYENLHSLKFKGEDYVTYLNDLASYFANLANVESLKKDENNKPKFTVLYKLPIEVQNDLAETFSPEEIDSSKLLIEIEFKRIDNESYIAFFSKLQGDKYDFITSLYEVESSFK